MQTKIVQWDFDAWEDYLYWQTQDKKMLKKINQLVKDMYKLQKVKEACAIGTCTDSFNNSYKWVPDELKEDLTPDQLGRLTESFYECYGAGKNDV